MTKYLIIIAILVVLYLYWKHQQNRTLAPKPDDIIERKGKEVFYETEDFDLDSDSDEENQTVNGPKSAELPSAKFIPINKKDD